MTEHPSLTPTRKPLLIYDNKTLTEVKQEVTEYASKLAATINEIESQASIYERDAVRQTLKETLKEEYDNMQAFLTQILLKLEQINPNATLEREVLEKLNKKLS